jgi:hypothetical protein
MSEAGFDHKAVAVLHQCMAHVTKLGFLAFALAIKACIGIGDGSVRFVRALLAVKIDVCVAAFAGACRAVARASLARRRLGAVRFGLLA